MELDKMVSEANERVAAFIENMVAGHRIEVAQSFAELRNTTNAHFDLAQKEMSDSFAQAREKFLKESVTSLAKA